MKQLNNKYWLGAPTVESVAILAPPIVSVLVVVLFHEYFTSHAVSTWWWVILVLCIDVSHVYSTLFRLYWDKETFRSNRMLLIAIPLVGFILGVALYSHSDLVFWRVLAYLAVYHFVRQQYGFMRLYARKESPSRLRRTIDSLAIYSATLYPVIYWHLHLTSELSWFVAGDFVAIQGVDFLDRSLLWLFIIILAAYIVKEVYWSVKSNQVNIPKNLVVVGTYLSWYIGIITYQADLLFTLVNVISHGIPYMGLIWIHGESRFKRNFSFNYKGLLIFIVTLLLLAYSEEFLWDVFVWNDHPEIFPAVFDSISESVTLTVLVPFLVLPQLTHYILDGFIWRFSKAKSGTI